MAQITQLMYVELAVIEQKEADRKDEKARKQAEKDNKEGFEAALNVAGQTRAMPRCSG